MENKILPDPLPPTLPPPPILDTSHPPAFSAIPRDFAGSATASPRSFSPCPPPPALFSSPCHPAPLKTSQPADGSLPFAITSASSGPPLPPPLLSTSLDDVHQNGIPADQTSCSTSADNFCPPCPPPLPFMSSDPPTSPCPPLLPPATFMSPPSNTAAATQCPPPPAPCPPPPPFLSACPPPPLPFLCPCPPPSPFLSTPQPPAPPLAAKISPAALRGIDNNTQVSLSPTKAVTDSIDRLVKFHPEYSVGRQCFQVMNRHTAPQLQEGPQCGLVALSIGLRAILETEEGSTQLENLSPSSIQSLAVEKGFSRLGEMFSAENMALLATQLTADLEERPEVTVEDVQVLEDDLALCQSFRNGAMFLVPYDCDFNHEPCSVEGRKAHWALLTGFVLATPKANPAEPDKSGSVVGSDTRSICHLGQEEADWRIETLLAERENDMLVLARQSKSLVLGSWKIPQLVASCKNLKTIDPKRNIDDYVVPEGGIEAGLCGKIIRLKKQGTGPRKI